MSVYEKAKEKLLNAPEWKKQLTDELLKPKRNRFPRRSVYASGVDEIWTADLADFHRYARQNKGFKFILVVVDVFSRYAWARPLKTKSGINMVEALQSIFQTEGPPETLDRSRNRILQCQRPSADEWCTVPQS